MSPIEGATFCRQPCFTEEALVSPAAGAKAHGAAGSISLLRIKEIAASIAEGKPAARIEPGAFVVNCKG